MKAPESILSVWKRFDSFPMETLTKLWLHHKGIGQREVSLMKEHREQYGITGNCFDLALWLLDEFDKEGIKAYPVGSGLHTEKAHAAVVAEDDHGSRYLCDLGDQWLQPVLIDRDTESPLTGFFPAASIRIRSSRHSAEIAYLRPGGKRSFQTYHLEPVDRKEFWMAAEKSSRQIYPKPLLECRIPVPGETAHWEFYDWKSFLSTHDGLVYDPPLAELDGWAERLHEKTGFCKVFLKESLEFYKKLGKANKL
jgi:hypothetical protein